MQKRKSRRDFLRAAVLFGIGGAVACAQSIDEVAKAADNTPMPFKGYLPLITKNSPSPTPTASPTPTKTPVPTLATPVSLGPRVVRVHANTVTNWTSGTYWDKVNQTVTDQMVQAGLLDLTEKSSLSDAWRTLIPNYQAGQKIAIKVNFNNSETCDGSTAIDAIIEPVNSIVKTLVEGLQVNVNDIWVFDAKRKIPVRFGSKSQFGVLLYDNSYQTNCNYNLAGWSEAISFHPPSGISIATEHLTDVITRSNYLINMPIMKTHNCAGITLGFKNHFGSIDDPGGLHKSMFIEGKCQQTVPLRTDYNPMVDIYLNSHIRNKTVLTLGDGIFGCLLGENQLPSVWSTFGNKPPKSLFFSTDPVAIDSVMADYLLAEKGDSIPTKATSYLPLAEAAGLGVYEHQNPWSGTYTKIIYRQLEL